MNQNRISNANTNTFNFLFRFSLENPKSLGIDWAKGLSDVNWDEMISFNGREISMFHSACKLSIKNKQPSIRFPLYRSALFSNDNINSENIEKNLLQDFILSDHADCNIAALLTLGMIVNCENNDFYYVDTLNDSPYKNLIYLLLCPAYEFDKLLAEVNFSRNDEELKEIILDLRHKYNNYLLEFKKRLQSAILALYKLDEKTLIDVRDVFETLPIKDSDERLFKNNTRHKYELAITKNLGDLIDQINTIKSKDSNILEYYKYGLISSINECDGDLKQYLSQAEPAIKLLQQDEVNYTKFFLSVSSEGKSLFLNGYRNYHPDSDIFAIADKLDVLKLMSEAIGTKNLTLDQTFENKAYSASLSNSIALVLSLYATIKDDVQVDDLKDAAYIIAMDYGYATTINSILLDVAYLDVGYLDSKSEKHQDLTSIAKISTKLIDLLIKAKKDNELINEKSPIMIDRNRSVRDGVFTNDALLGVDQVFTMIESASNLEEFIKTIRKITSLNLMHRLRKSNHFLDRDGFRFKSLQLGDVEVNSVASWDKILEIYQNSKTLDAFILQADEDFYIKFGNYGDIYEIEYKGAKYLIFLQITQSTLSLVNRTGMFLYTYHPYLIVKIDSVDNESFDAELYKLTFELCAQLNAQLDK